MLNTLSYRLLFIASLFMLAPAMQTFASDKTEDTMSSKQVSEPININKATKEELSMIKGIGASKAQAIIDYREKNGNFVSIEELVKVKGIGSSTLQKISSFISI